AFTMTGIRIVVPVPVDVVFHARIKLFACFKFREVGLTCLIARPRCIALDHPVSHRSLGHTGATLGATTHRTSSCSRYSSTRIPGSQACSRVARPRCTALDRLASRTIGGCTGATLGATAHHTSSDSRHSSTRKLGSHWNLLASTRHCKAPAH